MSNCFGIPGALCLPLCLPLFLLACGGNGGSGDGSTGAPANLTAAAGGGGGNAVAEGAWHTEQSNGNILDLLVLENGSLYALSASTALAPPLIAFDQGSYTVSGDRLAAQLTHYNDVGTTLTGEVAATVLTGISMTGTATTHGNTGSNAFSVKPTAAYDSTYRYNTGASLASVAGAWTSVTMLERSIPASFTLDTAGALTGTRLGCAFSGSLQPRASGKNLFNVRMAFGASPCPNPGLTVTGVAISYRTSTGKQRLAAALQDSSKAYGTMLYAQR